MFTTGCWYYRLARVAARPGTGSISTEMSGLDDRNRRDVREALQRLPAAIGLFSRRIVVPVMAELQVRRQMNLLTTEALAVATLADAEIAVSTESPLLQEAAAEIGIAISVLR